MRHVTLLSVLLVSSAAACGGGDDTSSAPDATVIDAAVAPAFRNPVDLSDEELAMSALRMIGANVDGADRNCNACHSITRTRLRSWEVLSDAAMANCLTDLEVDSAGAALAMTNCLRENPTDATTPYSPGVLGFYATAADLEWFTYLFDLAYGAEAEPAHDDFSGRVLMPRGEHASMPQGQFDILAEWVARDLVMLDDLLMDDTVPGDCTQTISAAVGAHVDAMATTGWAAVNAAANINMYGCAGAATVRDCMADQPLSTTTGYGATWAADLPGSKLRVLRQINYQSAYWTRSSADGRFVAHGGNDNTMDGTNGVDFQSTMIDLVDDHLIHMGTYYDPGFFPDNSGFAFQGSSARVCPQSVLTTVPAPVTFSYSQNSPPCTSNNVIGLYQHLGAALGGGDYWTISGQFESDSGGHEPTLRDPQSAFTSTQRFKFVPLEFDGASYTPGTAIYMDAPNEGDTEMSPSTELLISRVSGPGGVQNGFRLRKFVPTPSGGSYTVTADEIGRYCFNGGKPGFSFDERWMVYHHYIQDSDAVDLGFTGPADPGFQAYRSQGAANVYLVDLLTGDRTRITRMNPGQYALFPHFRSDGWIYIDVRISGSSTEYIVASDAALLVSGQ